MSIGYACLTVGVLGTSQKSCVLKNASEEKLIELISVNLEALGHILDYNIKNGIKLFRISSDLIPFGSNVVNQVRWWEIFEDKFHLLQEKIRVHKLRVSMHPGQYTVLNSYDEDVVERAIADLEYHGKVLDCLGMNDTGKIVLHIGGVYGDKEKSSKRFIENYKKLGDHLKRRIVIENDDKSYHIEDVLAISKQIGSPVVFDNLHHLVNPPSNQVEENYWIKEAGKTWRHEDGVQKIHYSQQNKEKQSGSHSKTICLEEFIKFYNNLDTEVDIMLEVKDKNLSAIKCCNGAREHSGMKNLEEEWGRYKYLVLEKSAYDYNQIRTLLKNKETYPVQEFYKIIETALEKPPDSGSSLNAILHIWGYFKDVADTKEKITFLKMVERYHSNMYKQSNEDSLNSSNSHGFITEQNKIKNNLWKLSLKYKRTYLLNSLYFFV